MIWTHNMKGMSYNAGFSPAGGPSSTNYQAITVSAGDQWGDAYAFALQNGRMLIGPFSLGGSIGTSGGYAMGGGISAFSPKYGLGVDNIIQYTLVLANGSIVTANAYQNPDLFWALRGGGPATFGVVLTVTYKSYPAIPVTVATFQGNITSNEAMQQILTANIQNMVTLTDMGWGGYMYILQTFGIFSGLWIGPNLTQAQMAPYLDPFAALMSNVTGGQSVLFYNSSTSYYGWYDNTFLGQQGPQVTGNIYQTSRLLSKAIAQTDPAGVASRLLSFPAIFKGFEINLGGQTNQVDPHATGANPGFRTSVASFLTNELWADGTSSSTINQQVQQLKQNTQTIDPISTNSAAYMNQGSLFEVDFKKTFYGSHYLALRAIKLKYDPLSLFIVANGVASDEWDSDLVCRVL